MAGTTTWELVDPQRCDVAPGWRATISARARVPSAKRASMASASATTCRAVRIVPLALTTMPAPVLEDDWLVSEAPVEPSCTRDGRMVWYTTAASGGCACWSSRALVMCSCTCWSTWPASGARGPSRSARPVPRPRRRGPRPPGPSASPGASCRSWQAAGGRRARRPSVPALPSGPPFDCTSDSRPCPRPAADSHRLLRNDVSVGRHREGAGARADRDRPRAGALGSRHGHRSLRPARPRRPQGPPAGADAVDPAPRLRQRPALPAAFDGGCRSRGPARPPRPARFPA